MAIKIEPGIIDGLPSAEYHGAKEWLGSTSLKTLALKTPAHYKYESEHQVFKDEFNIGTAAHSLILESDTTSIVVLEHQNYLTKAAKEAKAAAIAENKQPLLAKEWEQVQAMRDAVMDHTVAGPLFKGHVPERSFFWEQDGMKFKVRPDALREDLIVDLKTTVNADTNEFGKTAFNYGYFVSAALYQQGVERVTGKKLPFVFVNVEKTAPYLVSVTELDEDALDFGHMMIERATRIYKECTKTGVWPGYPTRTTTSLPIWAYSLLEDLELPELTFGKGN
ncbi:PD-(D/E)XK nuclease-like domain-containing protein [Glutamicibacter nicotianae]|uniref:PD-(D/E)XK nuclease-like domain-containing protein n=1 Tax=Glutamicibacter nicotianae TaxID=37929 RepID=UPI00167F8424|nr:PD-(D/E)XK nuclease-like domain-containing protein [Glutamicibacter nicotianae]